MLSCSFFLYHCNVLLTLYSQLGFSVLVLVVLCRSCCIVPPIVGGLYLCHDEFMNFQFLADTERRISQLRIQLLESERLLGEARIARNIWEDEQKKKRMPMPKGHFRPMLPHLLLSRGPHQNLPRRLPLQGRVFLHCDRTCLAALSMMIASPAASRWEFTNCRAANMGRRILGLCCLP